MVAGVNLIESDGLGGVRHAPARPENDQDDVAFESARLTGLPSRSVPTIGGAGLPIKSSR